MYDKFVKVDGVKIIDLSVKLLVLYKENTSAELKRYVDLSEAEAKVD